MACCLLSPWLVAFSYLWSPWFVAFGHHGLLPFVTMACCLLSPWLVTFSHHSLLFFLPNVYTDDVTFLNWYARHTFSSCGSRGCLQVTTGIQKRMGLLPLSNISSIKYSLLANLFGVLATVKLRLPRPPPLVLDVTQFEIFSSCLESGVMMGRSHLPWLIFGHSFLKLS